MLEPESLLEAVLSSDRYAIKKFLREKADPNQTDAGVNMF